MDLTAEHVRALAASLGLAIADDDLPEVTHRLNAFRDALAALDEIPLEAVEPLPIAPGVAS